MRSLRLSWHIRSGHSGSDDHLQGLRLRCSSPVHYQAARFFSARRRAARADTAPGLPEQTPAVGVTYMTDPALQAHVELGETDPTILIVRMTDRRPQRRQPPEHSARSSSGGCQSIWPVLP